MKLFLAVLALASLVDAAPVVSLSSIADTLSPIARAVFPSGVDDALMQERFLTLDCTAFEGTSPAGFGDYMASPDGEMQALDQLKEFRGGKPTWYEEVMDAMMILSCDNNEDNKERYVAEDEDTADCTGTAADSSPESGMCERKANCYWSKMNPSEDRGIEYTEEEKKAAKKQVDEYAVSVGKYLAGPIAAAVLNFVFTFLYFCCRCICRCRCAGAKPRPTPYKSWEIFLPIFFFAGFAFAMIGTGYTANLGNDKVTVALDRIFVTVDKGATDLQYFFGTAGRPIAGVADSVQDAVDEVGVIVDGSGWIATDMNGIVKRFSRFSNNYQATLATVGQDTVLNEVVTGMNATVDPIVENIQTLLNTLNTELVTVSDTIQEAAGGAADQISSMNDTIVQLKADMDSFKETNDSMSNIRQGGVLAIFAVMLAFVSLGFVGVISAFTPCKFDDYLEFLLHFTWMFGSIIGTITFIVGGIALVLSIGWSDMCQFMDIVKEDFSVLGEQAGTGLNACYNDTALLVAFNMTDKLDFAGPLENQLASVSDVDVSSSFSSMKTPVSDMGATIAAITLTDLGGTDLIDSFSQLTNAEPSIKSAFDSTSFSGAYEARADSAKCCYDLTFTEANILAPWTGMTGTLSCDTSVPLTRVASETAKQYITRVFDLSACSTYSFDNANINTVYVEMHDTVVAKNGMLADLGTDATFCASNTCPTPELGYPTTIMQSLDDYEAKMSTLMGDFDTMGSNMLGALINHVNDFTCNMRCGFLASFMDELQDNWCIDLLSGFLDIALSLVLLAFFNIPVCICSAILVNRFRGKWRCGVGSVVFAGADEGGRSIGNGKYAEEGGGEEVVEMTAQGADAAGDGAAKEENAAPDEEAEMA